MTIEELKQQLTLSMKARDEVRTRTIRSIVSAYQKREIELRGKGENPSEQELQNVIAKQAKMRKESIEMFTSGGRMELAASEEAELKILSSFLPEAMSDEEIEVAVRSVIEESGAETMKDMGRVMGVAMAKLKGKADGTDVQRIVKSLLS